jgi:hypothetical protein
MKTTLPISKYIPILGRFPRPKILTSLLTILALAGAADGIDTKAQQGTGNQPQSAQNVPASLFSFSCSLDYPPPVHGSGVAEYVPGFSGVILKGYLSEQGSFTKGVSWLAHIDAPGHLDWAVRPANENAGEVSDIFCRPDAVYAYVATSRGGVCAGKFAPGSMTPIKTVQFNPGPSTKRPNVQMHGESWLPLAFTIFEVAGDQFSLAVINESLQLEVSKSYSIPAFAGANPRYQVLRVPDGSGYYLVIDAVQVASDSSPAKKHGLGIVRVGIDGQVQWRHLYSFDAWQDKPLSALVATDGAVLVSPIVGQAKQSLLAKISPDGGMS